MQKQNNISEKLQTTWIKTYMNVDMDQKQTLTQFNPPPNRTQKDHEYYSTISAEQDRYRHDPE
jgi:hypothetical protein